jgi:hypothetical protein
LGCFREARHQPGAGLIWALAFALLAWIVFPAGLLPLFRGAHSFAHSQAMLSDARSQFPFWWLL